MNWAYIQLNPDIDLYDIKLIKPPTKDGQSNCSQTIRSVIYFRYNQIKQEKQTNIKEWHNKLPNNTRIMNLKIEQILQQAIQRMSNSLNWIANSINNFTNTNYI
ncbi:unnamed protein product [Paramecium sonneborni]|uniref:Uncharacterized protein n=1 Tax=Paramecium sonneborni TaxID=65129 RepID=A0A8S1R1S4_9CILI|nr:unnamed protein product [Paramecium sonneborni]